MRISDWSSDVCSSDLADRLAGASRFPLQVPFPVDNVTGIGLQPDAVGVELWLRTDPPIPSVAMPCDPRGEVCGHLAGASSDSATTSVWRNFWRDRKSVV